MRKCSITRIGKKELADAIAVRISRQENVRSRKRLVQMDARMLNKFLGVRVHVGTINGACGVVLL